MNPRTEIRVSPTADDQVTSLPVCDEPQAAVPQIFLRRSTGSAYAADKIGAALHIVLYYRVIIE